MEKPVRIGSASSSRCSSSASCSTRRTTSATTSPTPGLAAGLFCAISLVVGYYVPKALGIVESQAIASSMEIGVHNGTLAIFIAVEVLDSTEISIPAAVYSLIMFAFAAIWGSIVSRKVSAQATA